MFRHLSIVAAALVALGAPRAYAAEPAAAPEAAEIPDASAADQEKAKAAVTAYLDACKAAATSKKDLWAAAKAPIHPKRLEAIADDARRNSGVTRHALARWATVKEHYLKSFEITGTAPSGKGSVVVSTTEENFSVEDNGVEEGVAVEYFVVPVEGRWFIVDTRRGSGQFPASKVAASYKGYFAGEFELPKAPEPAAKGGKKGRK